MITMTFIRDEKYSNYLCNPAAEGKNAAQAGCAPMVLGGRKNRRFKKEQGKVYPKL
jgi:hypothetical protein